MRCVIAKFEVKRERLLLGLFGGASSVWRNRTRCQRVLECYPAVFVTFFSAGARFQLKLSLLPGMLLHVVADVLHITIRTLAPSSREQELWHV